MCQSLHWPQKHESPFLGGTFTPNLLAPAVVTPLRTLAKRCRRLLPLLAAPAGLLLTQGEAKAILTYNIFENAGNVVVQTSGSLDLTGAVYIDESTTSCGSAGRIVSSVARICTGPEVGNQFYGITGPTSFNGTVNIEPASSVTGISTYLIYDFFKLIPLTLPILQSSAAPHSMAQPFWASASPQRA
jgi:hypothetical protein